MPVTVTGSTESLRGAAAHLAGELQAGRVYRLELVATGMLKKLAQGLYYAPKQSSFGPLRLPMNKWWVGS